MQRIVQVYLLNGTQKRQIQIRKQWKMCDVTCYIMIPHFVKGTQNHKSSPVIRSQSPPWSSIQAWIVTPGGERFIPGKTMVGMVTAWNKFISAWRKSLCQVWTFLKSFMQINFFNMNPHLHIKFGYPIIHAPLGLFTKERITFRKPFWILILTLSRFESLILPFVNAKLFQIRLLKRKNKGCFGLWKPDSEHLWTQSSFGKWLMRVLCILEMHAGATHGSICTEGTKYYLAMRRSYSWSKWRLQCLWTHVVQITNPIRKRIVIRNGFRNVICYFVNRSKVWKTTEQERNSQWHSLYTMTKNIWTACSFMETEQLCTSQQTYTRVTRSEFIWVVLFQSQWLFHTSYTQL